MGEYTVPDRNYSLKMRDGTEYATSAGHVQVDDPRHAREIESSFTLDAGMIEHRRHVFSDSMDAGRACSECGFVAWSWSSECPRCHSPLREESP